MERRAVLKLVALTALSQKLNALPNAAMRHMEEAQSAATTASLTEQKEKQKEIEASYLGDAFRTIRFGIAEAHPHNLPDCDYKAL